MAWHGRGSVIPARADGILRFVGNYRLPFARQVVLAHGGSIHAADADLGGASLQLPI